MNAPARDRSVVRFEIAPRSIVLILTAIAAVWLAYRLWTVALVLIVALILVGTFNPLIEWMEKRGVKRGYALMLLFAGLIVAAGGLLFLTVPPLLDQLTTMVKNAPEIRIRLIAVLNERAVTTPLAHVVETAELQDTFGRAQQYLLSYSTRAITIVGYGVTVLVLAFYLLADGKRAQGVVYAIIPRGYHMRLARILQNLEVIVGGYMRGQLITSAAIGVFAFVLLVVCKVPNALSLALFAAIVDVIPFIGGLLVVIPAVLSALTVGLTTAVVVLAALVIYEEFENRILIPKVYGQVLRLSPAVIMLALIAGATLMGILGALLALPIAAGLLMILEELRVEMPGDDSVDHSTLARDAELEATYKEMSAGATAPEAAQIAKELVQESQDAELAATGDAIVD